MKKYIRFSDLKAGFLYALAGSALFSIIEGIRISIESIGDDHIEGGWLGKHFANQLLAADH